MKIYIGDITKIKNVDVLVNASDLDFTPGGGMVRWIEKEGGKEIYEEVRSKTKNAELGKAYLSGAGRLPYKKIFHVPTIDWEKDRKIELVHIHQIVVTTMEKAIGDGYSSIVFPLLGCGTIGLDDKKVFNEISDAIKLIEENYKSKIYGSICMLDQSVFEKINVKENIEVVKI